MEHIGYAVIAVLEFIAYLLIDPFHVNPGWSSSSKDSGVKAQRMRTIGYTIFVGGICAAILPVIFARIIAL